MRFYELETNRLNRGLFAIMGVQIDWQNIDTVLLDMDGTLLDLHYDNYFWRQHLPAIYGEKKNLSPEQAWNELEPLFAEHSGTLNWYSVHFWSEQLGLNIMQHKRDVADKIAYRPDAEEFLKVCRQNVTDLRLITNAHRRVLRLKILHTNLDQYFDTMLCSHELSAPKEDKKFWHNLQASNKFDPSRTVFIDDSETVLDAANEFGIANVFSIASPDSQSRIEVSSKYEMIENLLDTV